MKITIKPTKTFEVFAGDKSLGHYAHSSTWNGMTQLDGRNGMIVVDTPPDCPFENIFSGFMTSNDAKEVSVIRISPLILEKLKAEKEQ